MIEVDYVKISFKKVNALKSYRPKHPPERYFFFEHVTFSICIDKIFKIDKIVEIQPGYYL